MAASVGHTCPPGSNESSDISILQMQTVSLERRLGLKSKPTGVPPPSEGDI